ncbi:MAG TPA: CHAT domain-containing protein [Thermoanaerobaculia bacterium]
MKVYNCKLELQDEERVVYHDIQGRLRHGEIRLGELTKQLLRRFNYWVSKDKLDERDDLVLLGLYLYNLLPAKIRQEFESDYDFITGKEPSGSRLRLTLIFHKEAGELANYPWEFLYMPPRPKTQDRSKRDGFFLAGQKTELILTRFMPDVEHRLGDQEKELRILVVFSHPDDPALADIDTDDTRQAITMIEALAKPPSVQVKTIENPTYEELKDAINKPAKPDEPAFRPHIIHFIGHGDKMQGLALKMTQTELDDRAADKLPYKETAWQNSQTICDLFSDDPPPRLVFLHACEGARSDTLEGFSDLARELALAKIPAVVAMQYTIKTGDAATFAKVFYERLSNGSAVDEAVRAGREALGNPVYGGKGSWSDRRFGTPVVYLQSEEAIIKMPASIEMPASFDPDKKVPCPNPRCDGKVPLSWAVCLACEHEVMICPECQGKGEYFLLDKTIGRCGKCGHRLAGWQAAPAAAGVVPRPEKKAEAQQNE